MAAIPERTKRRACELIALGLSQAEAARATEMGTTTIEKILKQPEYKAIVDRKREEQAGLLRGAVDVIEAGLSATTHDGEPNHLVRTKAAESVLKNLDAIRDIEGGDVEYEDLEGMIHVFPARKGE